MRPRIELLFFIVMSWKPVVVQLSKASDVTKIVLLDERRHKDHELTYDEAKENVRLPHIERTYQDCPASCKPYTQYCHSQTFLDDHCCCNQGYQEEKLDYMPHTCYITNSPCRTSFGSCLLTMEIKSCCCDPVLVKKWETILSTANSTKANFIHLLCSLIFTIAIKSIWNRES